MSTAGFVKNSVAGLLSGGNQVNLASTDVTGILPDANMKPYRLWESDAGGPALTVDNGGKVGIGISSSLVAPLNFAASTADKISLYPGAAGSRYGVGIQSYETQFYVPTASHLSFNGGGDLQTVGTNEIMRICGNGKVAIGSPSSQYYNLDVVQPSTAAGETHVALFHNKGGYQGSSHGIKIAAGADGSAPPFSAGTRYAVFTTRNFTTTSAIVLNSDGTCQFSYLSDADRKENIRDTSKNALDIVTKVPVRDYRHIGYQTDATGFVAQEMEAFLPEAIYDYEEDMVVDASFKPSVGTVSGEDGATTKLFHQSAKMIMPFRLIPILWKAVQEQQAQKNDLDTKWKTYEQRLVALEEAQKASAAGALVQQGGLPGSAAPAVDEETVKKTADAVLRELGINPWVEVTMAEAWEEVEETVPTEVVKTVTKYRPNWETMLTESYAVEEKVVEKTPTGRRIKQLRPDARFDANTGKYYKWCGLGGATPAQTAAVLGKLLPGGTAVNGTANVATPAQTAAALGKLSPIFSVLSPQVSRLKTQDSGLQSQASIGR
jgi:hypothetical protein